MDKRADIWSFGVVFYEVLTGRRLFEGETVSDILAAVLTREPNWAALPAATPPAARRLLKQCLERNPANRLHDIADARLTLDEAVAGEPMTAHAGAPRRGRFTVALAALAVGLGLALAALALRWPGRAPDLPVTRFALSADPSVRPDTSYTTPFAVSRDGRTIVFAAAAEASTRMYLWVRTLDDPRPRRLEDTEGGGQPALSPDGEWVAFVAREREIKKVRLRGGAAVSLATIGSLSAALAWASDDLILFELLDAGTGLHRVSAHGGVPEPLVPLDTAAQETMQRRPFVLRAERMVVYASTTAFGRTGLSMLSLADGRRARLGLEGTRALGVIDGHLVYARHDGRLMAAPLDVRGMRVRGAPVTLPDTVASSGIGPSVALSESGTLVYRGKTAAFRLMLVHVAGRTARPLGAEVRPYKGPRFSPDGRFVAVGVGAGGVSAPASPEATSDLWLFDRQSGEATRLTRTGAAAMPEWTPDGKGLVYISGNPPHRREVFTLPLDGSAEPRRLVEIEGDVEQAVMTPDGRLLIVVREAPGHAGKELLRVPLQGGAGPSVLVGPAFAGSGSRPVGPRVSADGRFLAFEDENNWDVYVRALDGGVSLQVTDTEGTNPRWGASSGHLYYTTVNGWAKGEVQTSPTLAVVGRRSLGEFGWSALDYDLSPDEQTLVVVAPDPRDATVLVALHWGDEVRRTLGGRE